MSALSPVSQLSPFDFSPQFPAANRLNDRIPVDGGTADHGEDRDVLPAARSLVKRAMDIAGALLGLLLLGPVMLAIAALVRIDSPGPALFRQVRLGRNGKPFWCLKFRTMATDAERRLAELEARNEVSSGVLFKMRRDPRVTRLGRFLRATSLDELPQLINVLKGEMSLVGPRPLQLRDCQALSKLDPEGFARRLLVPSGLTGPWQVGGRSQLDVPDMLRLDLEYAETWSLALDIQIILRTIVVVVLGRGAY